MNITWDDNKGYGQFNGSTYTEKPAFSFSYAWLLITNSTAQFVDVLQSGSNKKMTDGQKQEVIDYFSAWTPPAEPEPTIDDLIAAKAKQIDREFKNAIESLTSAYPIEERESWPQQLEEAKAYTLDPSTQTPLLSSIASSRSTSLADLVTRVLAKNAVFSNLFGQALGLKQKRHLDLSSIDQNAPDAEAQISVI